jgi:hypothetical protein
VCGDGFDLGSAFQIDAAKQYSRVAWRRQEGKGDWFAGPISPSTDLSSVLDGLLESKMMHARRRNPFRVEFI